MTNQVNSGSTADSVKLGGADLPRATSGIEGLDYVLGGGFPRNGFHLILGNPGAGKTTLALQFLLDGVKRGENTLYIGLSESKEELDLIAHSHEWSLEGMHVHGVSAGDQLKTEAQQTVFYFHEVELTEITKAFLDVAEQVKPRRVVFDSLAELRLLAETPLRYRREILTFKEYFTNRDCTVLLIDDLGARQGEMVIESLVQSIIEMEQRPWEFGTDCRRLRVIKMRGIKFHMGHHYYSIQTGGLTVYPRVVAAEHCKEFSHQLVSSGVKELDNLLGGGLDRGSSSLLMGPAGAGKSSIALHYAVAAANRGEQVAIYSFEESLHLLLARCAGLGIDCKAHIESGRINFQHISGTELLPGELSHHIRHTVERHDTRMVVIDTINGYFMALRQERSLILPFNELLRFLAYQGVNTLGVVSQHGALPPSSTEFEISYLADTVLVFRYYEHQGELRQAISVFKRRGGMHERTIHELRLAEQGIRIGPPLREFHGILTGIPSYEERTSDDGP